MAIALAATVVNRNAMPATSRMATMLYIHRNTLTYRLQHIKELLKFDFDFEHNTDALFTLYLCICVYQLGYHKDFTS